MQVLELPGQESIDGKCAEQWVVQCSWARSHASGSLPVSLRISQLMKLDLLSDSFARFLALFLSFVFFALGIIKF